MRRPGDTVCIAGDLRPSTDGDDRSIMRVVAKAIQDAGVKVDNLGKLPTPALTYFGLQMNQPSVMVTGSHIPFDRNGIKFNRRSGEVLKEDERGILAAVAAVRKQEYARPAGESPFDDEGMFKEGVNALAAGERTGSRSLPGALPDVLSHEGSPGKEDRLLSALGGGPGSAGGPDARAGG